MRLHQGYRTSPGVSCCSSKANSFASCPLFLLCSVDAAWVPGARLQLLSQPSLKCENLSLKAQEWNFLWSFPKTATDYRIMTATGLFCYTLT